MNLRIPGPIPVPDEILETMCRQVINHRGPEFKELLYRITDRLKQVFETSGDVIILTASGTGAMEAALVNTLSPGDRVLCASAGAFGDRFGQIARAFGADVVDVCFEAGAAIDPDAVRGALAKDPEITTVLVTHNETSTGVTSDLESISTVVKGEFDKLLLVDGISSVCSLPLPTDAWRCDVVASASQKGWMVPPGLAFISFSQRAWDAHSKATMPRFYFDVSTSMRYFETGQPPWTPALPVMFALDLALDAIIEEGLEAIFARHRKIAGMMREGVKRLGLSLLPEDRVASDSVTAVRVPAGVDGVRLVAEMRKKHGVVTAGGQQALRGKIIRIGHMGQTAAADIQSVIDALEEVLPRLGFATGAAAAHRA